MKKLYLALAIVALLGSTQAPLQALSWKNIKKKAQTRQQKIKDYLFGKKIVVPTKPAPRYTTMPVADPVQVPVRKASPEPEYEAPQVDTPLPFVSEEEHEAFRQSMEDEEGSLLEPEFVSPF